MCAVLGKAAKHPAVVVGQDEPLGVEALGAAPGARPVPRSLVLGVVRVWTLLSASAAQYTYGHDEFIPVVTCKGRRVDRSNHKFALVGPLLLEQELARA